MTFQVKRKPQGSLREQQRAGQVAECQPGLQVLHDDDALDRRSILAKTMNALFLETSDLLDIHSYSFRGNVHILADQAAVAAAHREMLNKDFTERSFYRHDTNTIYISAADLTLGMLGHEMAHAIISHFFVIPPLRPRCKKCWLATSNIPSESPPPLVRRRSSVTA